jgi:hypothetical protein
MYSEKHMGNHVLLAKKKKRCTDGGAVALECIYIILSFLAEIIVVAR